MVLTFPEFIFLICNVYSPDASEKYAIDVPFGDHSGYFSCTPVVAVIFSGSPFSAGTVTIVKVGYLGGYKVTGFNLIVSGSPSHLGEDGKMVVATFLPAVNNSNGSGDISGSVAYPASASNFTLSIDGTNASASVSSITLVEDGSAVGLENAASNYILKVMPTEYRRALEEIRAEKLNNIVAAE